MEESTFGASSTEASMIVEVADPAGSSRDGRTRCATPGHTTTLVSPGRALGGMENFSWAVDVTIRASGSSITAPRSTIVAADPTRV